MQDEIVKVGERGQIVIPAKIRRQEGIKPDSYLRIVDIKGNIVIRKIELEPIDKLAETLTSLKMTRKHWKRIQKERSEE
ncbi:MAG: AbrB/MazE/SpoVT family DNA-binding domain-containing protein [Candidatus Thermoplasmatota archaeon]|nr:AbrB/MazE/SpoVT family DNA-binding domain-containing protein [Candidatus Thermoplasmatota archaeon]